MAPTVRSLLSRLPMPGRGMAKLLGVAAVLTQAGIGVTGSVVRVTGSGLGCPTWPQCFPGSMFPVQHPEFDTLNQWIEYTNRMLVGVVGLVAGLCLLAAWRIHLHRSRRRLLVLGTSMPAGVLLQAGLGGVTVRLELLWWTVAVHFLVSAAMVWLASMLLHAFAEGDEEPRWYLPPVGRRLLTAAVVVLGALLVAGTMLTGAGPHGGDPETPRLQLPIETLSTVHGGLLVLFLVLLTGLGTVLYRRARAVPPPARLWRRYAILLAVTIGQGTLGSVQYALGVPAVLVSFHVLGSFLVLVALAAVWCAARERGPSMWDTAPSARPIGTGATAAA